MNIFKRVMVAVYLLQQYRVRLWYKSLSHSSTGSFMCQYQSTGDIASGRTFMKSVTKAYVHVDWGKPTSFITFLHEIGHIAQHRRGAKHRFPSSHTSTGLYSERRASVWAIRVAKIFKQDSMSNRKHLDWCYGTYIAHFCKGDAVRLSKESYKAHKQFGVRYE